MKFLSFDLELNQAKTGAKIIEVGACIGDTVTCEILETYNCIVDPFEKLEQKIINLTGITQTEVEQGHSISQAYLGMKNMASKHGCMRMPLVWGTGDGNAIRSELPKEIKWIFGRRELDVKAVYQAYQVANDGEIQAGLNNAMENLGLNFQGKIHRATNDAVNTFFIFCELLQRFGT